MHVLLFTIIENFCTLYTKLFKVLNNYNGNEKHISKHLISSKTFIKLFVLSTSIDSKDFVNIFREFFLRHYFRYKGI